MIDFDTAPGAFAKLLIAKLGSGMATEGLIVRDVYGRLSFVSSHSDLDEKELRTEAESLLGAYAASRSDLLVSLSGDDEEEFRQLQGEPTIPVNAENGDKLRMIDRRLAGEDWLMRPQRIVFDPRRLIFYSVKGGVGRSTALAIAAADLAANGRNVLVVDFDLEAPGLGAFLLAPESVPKYGVTDWFAAVAAGANPSALIPDMIGPSEFTSSTSVVDVVPANGGRPEAYLSKLARAYMPGSAGEQYAGLSFAKKADLLISQLTEYRHYDTVLIDARAGLHETSGGLVLGLGARVLIFGIDTSQTFEDFGLLFAAFAQALDPAVAIEDIRRGFKMVHAKAPRDEKDRRPFRERCWQIWSDYLYDDVDLAEELSGKALVFDLGDEEAPHYPLEIIGDESYARFVSARSRTCCGAAAAV
jgi:hypothetical protein